MRISRLMSNKVPKCILSPFLSATILQLLPKFSVPFTLTTWAQLGHGQQLDPPIDSL